MSSLLSRDVILSMDDIVRKCAYTETIKLKMQIGV